MPTWEGMGLAAPGFSLVRTSLELRIKIRLQFRLAVGFPGGSDRRESACNVGDLGSLPGSGRSLEEEILPTPVFLPGKFHGQRSLAGYSHSSGLQRVGLDLVSEHKRNTYMQMDSLCVLKQEIPGAHSCPLSSNSWADCLSVTGVPRPDLLKLLSLEESLSCYFNRQGHHGNRNKS